MNQPKKYLLGFRVLCWVILLRLLILGIVYFAAYRYSGSYYDLSSINIFSAYQIGVLIILFFEALIYWSIKFRIANKYWVKAHVWLIFFSMIMLPFFTWLILIIAPQYLSLAEFSRLRFWASAIRFYFGWGLIIVAHIFFILTLVDFFNNKNLAAANSNPADVLDEFSE
jgi:hypothetical protein